MHQAYYLNIYEVTGVLIIVFLSLVALSLVLCFVYVRVGFGKDKKMRDQNYD